MHLALAITEPDAKVADELERASSEPPLPSSSRGGDFRNRVPSMISQPGTRSKSGGALSDLRGARQRTSLMTGGTLP